jgi:hypothetical protein
MRRTLVLLLVLVPSWLSILGCGGQPDPRDEPGFVDTSENPSLAADALKDYRPPDAAKPPVEKP